MPVGVIFFVDSVSFSIDIIFLYMYCPIKIILYGRSMGLIPLISLLKPQCTIFIINVFQPMLFIIRTFGFHIKITITIVLAIHAVRFFGLGTTWRLNI